MFTKRTLLAGMAATGFGLAAARPASAQTYPTRPVKMVVPLPPGSAPDVRHRLIAQALTQLWGQQVIVENRPGGGGIIGTRAVLGEQPDGYTLLAALASIYLILPAQQENLPSFRIVRPRDLRCDRQRHVPRSTGLRSNCPRCAYASSQQMATALRPWSARRLRFMTPR